MATSRARPADLFRWRTERDAIYNQVFEKGWNPRIGGFTQFYGSEVLDSSLLMMPQQGFIAPKDPMWLSTLQAIDRELVSDSLVYRYNPSASPDGLAGNEGTFSLCTFWYVDTLARAGRLNEGVVTFEKMHTYANHLGLYSEEIGSHRRAARQLPAGVQPPGPDQRRRQPRPPARPRRGRAPRLRSVFPVSSTRLTKPRRRRPTRSMHGEPVHAWLANGEDPLVHTSRIRSPTRRGPSSSRSGLASRNRPSVPAAAADQFRGAGYISVAIR